MVAAAAFASEGYMDQAFEATFRAEGRRLYGIAYTILGDPDEAAEAVQDTMVRAWRSWPKTHEFDSPRPWLTRICINSCLDRRRGLRRRWWRSVQLRDDTAAPAAAVSDGQLAAAFARLPTRQRAVVLLHYHCGYSLDECAGLMGCRPGTARSHLHRALTALRKDLSDD